MPAQIIEFEGLDCSFKETNSKLLAANLQERGFKTHLFSFPNYESDSSSLVRMFLNGVLGFDNSKIPPHMICEFYAMDRALTYYRDIQDIYEKGNENTIIIFDRWVFSNFYQLARMINHISSVDDIRDGEKRIIKGFIDWLQQLEFGNYRLPRANAIFFMRTPYEVARKKIAEKADKDINEKDEKFTKKVYIINDYIFNHAKNTMIVDTCYSDGKFKSRETLGEEVLARALSILEK